MAKKAAKASKSKGDNDIKRVYRSRTDRILGGVCGGVGKFFNVDPVWIRILFVLTLFAMGFGILAYLVCWIIIPLEPLKN